MRRYIVLCLFLFSFGLTAETVKVGILVGPSSIPLVKMMDSNEKINSKDVGYEQFSTPQNLLPKMLKNEIDIGFMPLNVAAKVFNSSGEKIICAAICGEGNLSLITKDKAVKKLSDLKNKTVTVAGKGATPEYIFKYVLCNNKLKIDEQDGVFLDFSTPTPSIAGLLISDKIKYAVLPEPFTSIVMSKSEESFYSIDLQKEFTKNSKLKTSYPLTVIVIRGEFAASNMDDVKEFLELYADSSLWVQKNPKDAGSLCEKLQIGVNADVAEVSIPKSAYVYKKAADSKKEIESLLKIFLEYDGSSIGGKLPSNNFYLNW